MTLSVCMIVKNEHDVLDRVLRCASKFADEIIVVDTGSTDDTIDIAKRYTEKVYNFKWCDDFSLARNYSFSLATMDYIMWLDADDVVTFDQIQKIIELKKIMTADYYMCYYAIAFDESNNATFKYYRERIMRSKAKPKWCGAVHEAIAPSGKIEYVDIVIEHRKYHAGNSKRNLNIYNKLIRNGHTLNAREQYYYAKELYYNGYYKKAIVALNKYLKFDNKFVPNELDAIITLSKCLVHVGKAKKALGVLMNNMPYITPTAEYMTIIGDIVHDYVDKRKSVYYYECALLLQPNFNSGAFVNMDYYYLIPYLQLVRTYWEIGERFLSQKYHLLTKSKYPHNKSVQYNDKFFNKINDGGRD